MRINRTENTMERDFIRRRSSWTVIARLAFGVLLACVIFSVAAPATAANEPKLAIDTGGHHVASRFMTFTRDGKYQVSGGDDKTVRRAMRCGCSYTSKETLNAFTVLRQISRKVYQAGSAGKSKKGKL